MCVWMFFSPKKSIKQIGLLVRVFKNVIIILEMYIIFVSMRFTFCEICKNYYSPLHKRKITVKITVLLLYNFICQQKINKAIFRTFKTLSFSIIEPYIRKTVSLMSSNKRELQKFYKHKQQCLISIFGNYIYSKQFVYFQFFSKCHRMVLKISILGLS